MVGSNCLILSTYQRRGHLYMYVRPSLPPRHLATLPPGTCPIEPFNYPCVVGPLSYLCIADPYEPASSNRNAAYSQQFSPSAISLLRSTVNSSRLSSHPLLLRHDVLSS